MHSATAAALSTVALLTTAVQILCNRHNATYAKTVRGVHSLPMMSALCLVLPGFMMLNGSFRSIYLEVLS
jgi:hypothetical protein